MSGAIKTRDLVHKISLLSKFKGALVGAVVGDCLGAPFEASWDVKLEAVKRFFSQLQSTGTNLYTRFRVDECNDKNIKELRNSTCWLVCCRSTLVKRVESPSKLYCAVISLKTLACSVNYFEGEG